MAQADVSLYLDRARKDLEAAESNLERGFYAVSVTRAYYAMFYAASALLASKEITRSKHSAVLAAFGEQFAKPGLTEADFPRRSDTPSMPAWIAITTSPLRQMRRWP